MLGRAVYRSSPGNFPLAASSCLTLEDSAIVAYAGLLPSLVSQILYVRGVELIGPNRAGLFINTIPMFGTPLSIALIGEALRLSMSSPWCWCLAASRLRNAAAHARRKRPKRDRIHRNFWADRGAPTIGRIFSALRLAFH